MGTWVMKEGNAYWNDRAKQWTSRELATEFTDSEVDGIELTGDAHWEWAEMR
ncbi:MAG: hypothetical protein ABFE01_15770 [Phycisphaerales bacterium]